MRNHHPHRWALPQCRLEGQPPQEARERDPLENDIPAWAQRRAKQILADEALQRRMRVARAAVANDPLANDAPEHPAALRLAPPRPVSCPVISAAGCSLSCEHHVPDHVLQWIDDHDPVPEWDEQVVAYYAFLYEALAR